MKAIGDLFGLGHVDSRAFSVESVAIAADDFNTRMMAQPHRQACRSILPSL
jgi:hypothetical protein